MAFYGLRLEYALDDNMNYIDWKDRLDTILEDNGLKEFIDQDIPKPPTSDAKDLAEREKCVAKARQITLEGVQDNIVSSLRGKEISYAIWKKLVDLYQSSGDQRKLALKDKL